MMMFHSLPAIDPWDENSQYVPTWNNRLFQVKMWMQTGQIKKMIWWIVLWRYLIKWLRQEINIGRGGSQPTIVHSYEARGCTKLAIEVMEQMIFECESSGATIPIFWTYQHEPAGAYQADGQINCAVEFFEHIVNVEYWKHPVISWDLWRSGGCTR